MTIAALRIKKYWGIGWTGLCLILCLTASPGFAEPFGAKRLPVAAAMTENPPDIEAFVRAGCPHCAKAEEFLADLARRRPDLRILIRDVSQEPGALERLARLTQTHGAGPPRVPAFLVGDQLLVGYADATSTGGLILSLLDNAARLPAEEAGACGADEESRSCGPGQPAAQAGSAKRDDFAIDFLGRELSLKQIGLPLFTLAMGLLDGFNPCSMWVLLLMLSFLAPMGDRRRMLAVAGTFVAVEGVAYFAFMAAWLNLFLFVGLSRAAELVVAALAILAGAIHIKDFFAFGRGPSLSIPDAAKPGIYSRIRGILQARDLHGAIAGAAALAALVQIVEFLCTSGLPALYTRILTLREPNAFGYYGYLLLYNLAYMLDDFIVLGAGVVTLSQARLQEKQGRWLKLASGLAMAGLGAYLALAPFFA
jgi:glutaredoxin